MKLRLRNGEQRIKIAFLSNQHIKGSGFRSRSVFQSDNAVIMPEQGFLQRVRNHDAGYAIQPQNCAGHLMSRFSVQRGSSFIRKKNLRFFKRLRAMAIRCFSPPDNPLPFSPQR